MNMVVEKNLRIAINFYKKLRLPVVTWNRKHLSKQAEAISYALEKKSFAVVALKVSFQTE